MRESLLFEPSRVIIFQRQHLQGWPDLRFQSYQRFFKWNQYNACPSARFLTIKTFVISGGLNPIRCKIRPICPLKSEPTWKIKNWALDSGQPKTLDLLTSALRLATKPFSSFGLSGGLIKLDYFYRKKSCSVNCMKFYSRDQPTCVIFCS